MSKVTDYVRLSVITLILVFTGYSLTGCTNEQDQYIQGKWARGDVHYWAEWNFDRGYYTYSYEYINNRPSIRQAGRYRIIESGEDFLTVELHVLQGDIQSLEDRVEMRIDIDREQDSLSIRRQQFTRILGSSLEALSTAQAP